MIARERAATLIGISSRLLDREIAAGLIITVRIGRRRLIVRDSLREYLEAGLAAGAAQ